ncbi:MAG: T9SS type A sorting domain-containing protein [Bacteroidota bacterium]
MKKFLLLLLIPIISSLTLNAATGWFQDYLKLNPNNTGEGFYWIGANPSFGTQLQGLNFGNVSSLVITGCDMKYWGDGADRTGGAFYYKIMSSDGATQIVAPVETIWTQTSIGGNDFQGLKVVGINLLNGLTLNTQYQLHIWAKSWGSSQGDSWLTNSGANYVATFTYTSTTFTGTALWTVSGNWSAGVPAITSNAVIAGTATITTDVTVNDLTINNGGILNINSGKSLTVSGTLTNNAAEGIVLKSPDNSGAPGSLITNGTVGGTGTLKAERYITAYTSDANGWHFLSSPINTPNIASNTNLTPGATTDDFFAWDEVHYQWLDQKVGTNNITTMVNGNGYLVAYQTAATKYMIGAPNNTDMTFTNLTKTTGKGEGWHLLGNPFTSAIKWNNGSYAISGIGLVAKLMGNMGGYTDIGENNIIPAMQGFFVQAASAVNAITIPLNARTHSTTNWTKSAGNSHILLTANDLESQMVQESWVRVNDQATSGYDYQYDSHFMPLYAPQFYSLAGDEKLSTNCLPSLPAESLIPFGFVKNDASSFSIELKESIDGYQVFLKDLKINTDQNLTENPVYTFTSEANDDTNRFLLHFLSTVGTSNPVLPTTSRIYISNRNIYIEGLDAKAEILVRNMLGQVVASRNANGTGAQVINTANLTAGVYVVSIVTGNQVRSEKVVIK